MDLISVALFAFSRVYNKANRHYPEYYINKGCTASPSGQEREKGKRLQPHTIVIQARSSLLHCQLIAIMELIEMVN